MGHIPDELGITTWATTQAPAHGFVENAAGYGTDPNMITPTVPWSSGLTADELADLVSLADIILPPQAGEPAPSQMGIGAFLGEWLSAPYPTQQKHRAEIMAALPLLDTESQARFGKPFRLLAQHDRVTMVTWMATCVDPVRAGFVRLRHLVTGGYYTSDVGMKMLGYYGNVPLNAFPAVTSDGQAAIDEILKALGLDV